jgi:predicted NBD/HSP70 family sugar kinase
MPSRRPVDAHTRDGRAPIVAAPVHGSPGEVLSLIRERGELTRAEIVELSGLARATVASRLEALQSAGLISPVEPTTSVRGRPPSRFRFREDAGVLLIADAGATRVRIAVTDLGGRLLEHSQRRLDITEGPERWLTSISEGFRTALNGAGMTPRDVHGIGLALPGPVDSDAGTVVSPPIMTGWDQYPIRSWFRKTFTCPVIVENDANAMAIGEHRLSHPQRHSMLMLKLATGIGAGIIAGGEIYRGADGAAGDIGHIQVTLPDEGPAPQCRCGNIGCIEAYAGGWALVRDLRATGIKISTVPQVVSLINSGDATANRLARRAGRLIGIALSDAVSLLNPEVVVLGGELAAAENHLFAGIRESVYARSLPLATRHLTIQPSSQGDMAGVSGLVAALTDHLYAPTRVDRLLSGTPDEDPLAASALTS